MSSLATGKAEPPQLRWFLAGVEPQAGRAGVFSRRAFGPCTWIWGSCRRICGRCWLPSGSTRPPSCHTHRSFFGMNSRFLEKNGGDGGR